MNDMDWLNKSAEQNLDEILAMADINARLRIICGTEKQADGPRKLGPRQHAYVADATGGTALENTGALLRQQDMQGKALYDQMILAQAPMAQALGARIRRGASRLSNSQSLRLLAMIDPTSDGNTSGLVEMATGLGKPIPHEEAKTREMYAKHIKPHQDKLRDPEGPTTSRETPWHIAMQGQLANLDSDVAGHAYMRRERPVHYWLNPVSKSGPLSETFDRWLRRHFAGSAVPESTRGRFAAAAIPGVSEFLGGEEAQNRLRRLAVKNKLYDPVAEPDVIESEKQAWEVDDDTGSYSDWPLRYAAHLTEPPQVPITHPDYDREVTTKTLQQAVKKLPPNRKLHWVDNDAVLGERSWYNPARYLAGKQITGDKNYELGQDSDDKSRADIIQQILDNYEGRNALMAHYPARYYEDDEDPEAKSPAKQAGMQETLGNATEAVKGWAGDATDAVKGWASGLPAAAQGAVDSARPWVNSALNSAQGAASSVQDWAGKNPWLAAGLGGAGLGAAGLAAINRMNPDEDERDLSNSLRTGAITGAGLGLGGMALAKHLPGVLSGLGVNPKVDDLTKQIGETAKAPYLRALARDAATDGTKNTALGAFHTAVTDPLFAATGNAAHAVANPNAINVASAAGGLAAAGVYGHDAAHAALTRFNLARGNGLTNDPKALREGIVAAMNRSSAGSSGKPSAAAARPWYRQLLSVLTGSGQTPRLTPETQKALGAIAEGGGSDALLRSMLYNSAAGRNSIIGDHAISPGVVKELANAGGYTRRAGTPLRYEAAIAAKGLLPDRVVKWLAEKPKSPSWFPNWAKLPSDHLRMPKHPTGELMPTPFRAKPSLWNSAKGVRGRGWRGPAALAMLHLLNRQNEGQ